ncbi:hypothetical protein HJC23_005217 [Cyclotella cryptica]|uniref:Tetrapyrrole methylase domain-containing protein n=1 Tax=Cyclotella cryptica TaxID=29204 RepID=A0ABD3P444_9STRA|eukprot:CCRYP_017793-RA/>CCRYP_017793-RA protein AED:0.30 eAED:0.30 QI:212/1/1/1/0.5/0.33/3/991/481
MKLSIALLLPALSGISAFLPSHQPPSLTTTTQIHRHPTSPTPLSAQRTLGFETTGLYTEEEAEQRKKQSKITQYIRQIREKIAIRPTLGKTVLVSGFDPTDPSASMVLDFLNSEEAIYFPFTTIVAHVQDVAMAKKRMIGRNARYTGLLDKLEFSAAADEQGGENGVLIPNAERLADVSSWVVHIGGGELEKLKLVVEAAEAAGSVKNVAVLVSGAGAVGSEALKEAEEMMKREAKSFAYTMVVVPEWNDQPEALCAYGILNVTDVGESGPFVAGETFSREESLRIVTECLAIEKAEGRCLVANAFPDKKSVENMLIQGMRESGFSRIEEIGMMVMNGSKGCMDLIEEKQKPPEPPKDQRTPEQIKAEEENRAKLAAENQKRLREERLARERQAKLDEMAKEWAEREYFRKKLRSELLVNKDQFVELIWDRAIFESNLRLRTIEGFAVNEGEERRKWKEAQKKKKAAEMAATRKMIEELEY